MKMTLKVVSILFLISFKGTSAYNGRQDTSTLIIDGRPARQGEVPYQLSLRVDGVALCGASLIEVGGIQVGLTAAHCVVPNDFYKKPTANIQNDVSMILIAGELNLTDTSGLEQIKTVQKAVGHEGFSWSAPDHDIALVFISSPYQLNENVGVIQLPNPGQATEGNLTISGWGYVHDPSNGGYQPDLLHIVETPLTNHTQCIAAYEDFDFHVTENMICAERPKGPCNGDSGGPAVSDSGYLAGIVSWGNGEFFINFSLPSLYLLKNVSGFLLGCEMVEFPSVFTKVANYIGWIEQQVDNYKKSLK